MPLTPATPPDVHIAAEDATAPTPSPPTVAAGAQMASVNETPAGASTTTAFDGLLLITYLSISLCEIRLIYYCAKKTDPMNIPKNCKSNNGIGARFRQEIKPIRCGSGKKTEKPN